MARDRLAAMRAQQGGGGYGNLADQAYNGPAQTGGGGYQGRLANPYDQRDRSPSPYRADDAGRYEMSNISAADLKAPLTASFNASTASFADDGSNFYAEISSLQDLIRTLNDNVSRISDLHSRSLNNMDDAATQRNTSQLSTLVSDTGTLGNDLKKRIKKLEKNGASGVNAMVQRQQIAATKAKFVEAIQNYQGVEQQFRAKYKQRMERQYKIVKPDATPEEVRAVVNDEQGGQIFSQALMNSNRYGESRAAFREVQERHDDILKIEKTLTELAQLFNDMSVMVEQQDEGINVIQTYAEATSTDMEAGAHHTTMAVQSARSARKKRWICFGIIVVVIAIIAIVVVVEVLQHQNASK